MPVRLRITLLFTTLVFIILSLVCGFVYYISYTYRVNTITNRLKNRAITTARLLSQSEVFNRELIQRIDSLTTISFKRKTVQGYDYRNIRIYRYSDVPGDTLAINKKILDEARVKESVYFTAGNKEAVAYHYVDNNARIVMIAAGEDVEGKKNLHQLLIVLLFSFLGGTVIAFASGYFFSKGLLRPIKKIADDANEISAHNLTRRIHTGTVKDEWYYLSATLNELMNRLQESFDLQKRFIANASHELSTPLTSISSQLEVSLQRPREAEEYRKVMQSIYQDVRHMSKLTQTLLEFAKASGSPGGLEITSIRIDEVLLRLPAEIVKTNKDYSISLQFDELPEEEEALLVYGNEELLFTAIKNIAINACKYSGNHHTDVRLAIQPGALLITIQDKGVGIPVSELENIFQPFYRVDESRHTASGFGLGLSLAHRIIKLHKGNIQVTSAMGEGTRFAIELPAASKV